MGDHICRIGKRIVLNQLPILIITYNDFSESKNVTSEEFFMSTKIPIETSARHIHVSQEDFRFLFGEDAQLHYTKELSQPGQYLCQERLTVKGPKGEYQNMALLGPFRKETQVELSLTDTRAVCGSVP